MSYNDSKYLELDTPAILATTTAFPATAQDTAFRYAPKLTFGGSIRYETEIGPDAGSLAFNLDAYRSSRVYFGAFKADKELSQRTEERRVGKECGSKCRSRRSQ